METYGLVYASEAIRIEDATYSVNEGGNRDASGVCRRIFTALNVSSLRMLLILY